MQKKKRKKKKKGNAMNQDTVYAYSSKTEGWSSDHQKNMHFV